MEDAYAKTAVGQGSIERAMPSPARGIAPANGPSVANQTATEAMEEHLRRIIDQLSYGNDELAAFRARTMGDGETSDGGGKQAGQPSYSIGRIGMLLEEVERQVSRTNSQINTLRRIG